jgi:hypothetical protein
MNAYKARPGKTFWMAVDLYIHPLNDRYPDNPAFTDGER